MGRTVILPRKPVTLDERKRREQLTTERIRALTSDEMRGLLEALIQRNDVTGILLHAEEYVDKTAMNKI